MFFTFNNKVKAGICDREGINNLKKLAEQVDVSYEYIDNSESGEEEFVINQYEIVVNLISEDLCVSDGENESCYNDSDNGLVKLYLGAGNVNIDITSYRCSGYRLKTINLKLPKFNSYSYREECKKLKEYNLEICDPWYQGGLDEISFTKYIDNFLKENTKTVEEENIITRLVDIFKNYYLYIITGCLLISVIIIFAIIRRKRSVLE